MKNAIKEGKIALEDKEGIDKIRKSVTVNAEEDVSVDHVKRRLEILSKARAARQVVNSEGRTSTSSRERATYQLEVPLMVVMTELELLYILIWHTTVI